MRAYKAFNAQLQAIMGMSTFQFAPGETYEETECKCARNGFHCAENPLCTLNYYHNMDARFFIVEAAGDINQDGAGSRISCTKITLIQEISRPKLAAHACLYMQDHPNRDMESVYVTKDRGRCKKSGDFIIVRGKFPVAAGVKGAYLFLVQEKPQSKEISIIYPFYVDGEEIRENTWYGIKEGELCKKRRCAN